MASYSQNCLAWLLIMVSFATFVSFTYSLPITQRRVSNPFRVSPNNGCRMLLNTKQHLYNQTMDHFNYRPESYRTFRQKYVIADDYWGGAKNNAPIFVYLGAEEPIDSDVTYVGLLHKFAPHFKAFITYDTSKSCYETIVRSWEEMDKLGSTSKGLLHLSKKFNTCSTLNNTDGLGSFLLDFYRQAAQYDAPPEYPLSGICQTIDKAAKGATDLDKVAALVSLPDTADCLEVASSAATKLDSSSDQTTLGWQWQSCNEMMNPMGTVFNSSIKNTMIPANPFDLQTFIQNCNDTFGVPTRPSWLNTYYGSRDLRLVLKRFGNNIIFSNGLKDPYRQEGVLESISETLIAIKAPHGSHCLDLYYATDSDPKWLKAMRMKEVKIMKKWLTVYYDDVRAYLNGL